MNLENENLLDHLPDDLKRRILQELDGEPLQVVAPYDLDGQGQYVEAFLVLTENRLGSFQRGEQWQGGWRTIHDVTEAVIVEGIGMSLLRLLAARRSVAEYRFTLRHSKDVARLQRRIERRISGKEESESPAERPKPDEKKIRCEKCGRVIPSWSETCPSCLSRKQVLTRLMDFVKPYRWQAVFGMAIAVLSTLAMLCRPYLTRPMLDQGLGAAKDTQADYRLLMFYVSILVGLTLLSAGAEAVRGRLTALLGSKVSRDIRNRAYEHLHSLSLSFFSRKTTGSLVSRITSDSDRIWDFVAYTLLEAGLAALTILGVGVALFIMDWKLAMIVLLPIPLMLTLMIVFHKKLHSGWDKLFHRWSLMTSVVADALPGVRVIKAFSQEKSEVARFGHENTRVFDEEVGMISVWTLFGPVMQLSSQIGTLLVWIVGGWWAVQGRISPGTLMAFIGYMWMFYQPIHSVAHMDRMLTRAASSVQRILEILDTEPAIYSESSATMAPKFEGRIELRDVSFSYDGVRKVLRNVSMAIAPGEMIGLAGPSGGGKTTLVNLICRFYDVLEGRILIDGKDIRDYEIDTLRRQIGVVLQEPFLFHGTVARNIAYGNPQATVDQIISAAKAANAHDFIVGFPDGYDTLVGERGHTLSGGERQRISIARAILNNPRILILDEATSSVDTETEKLIQEALARLIENRTTIAIAHRLSTLRKADRLIILDKGVIVEEGSHEALSVKEGGIYAKLLRLQTEMQAIMAIGG